MRQAFCCMSIPYISNGRTIKCCAHLSKYLINKLQTLQYLYSTYIRDSNQGAYHSVGMYLQSILHFARSCAIQSQDIAHCCAKNKATFDPLESFVSPIKKTVQRWVQLQWRYCVYFFLFIS